MLDRLCLVRILKNRGTQNIPNLGFKYLSILHEWRVQHLVPSLFPAPMWLAYLLISTQFVPISWNRLEGCFIPLLVSYCSLVCSYDHLLTTNKNKTYALDLSLITGIDSQAHCTYDVTSLIFLTKKGYLHTKSNSPCQILFLVYFIIVTNVLASYDTYNLSKQTCYS